MKQTHKIYLVLMTLAAVALDQLFPGNGNYVTAALLGALTTGAGITSTFAGQFQLEEYIVIGDIDTTNPLQGLYIANNSDTKIDIQTAVLVTAFFKLYNNFVGTVVGLQFKVSTGRIKGSTTYRFTNAGATTPNIYINSNQEMNQMPNGKTIPAAPVLVTTDTINANSNQTYKGFTALQVIVTNVSSFDVTMWDGSTQNMTALEMDGWFAEDNPTEANGRLESTVTTIDNRDGKYRSVKINTGAGTVTLSVIKLPDAYFQTVKASLKTA